MNRVAEELDAKLKQLDATKAGQVERLVRDALALADAPPNTSNSPDWPPGYFDRTAGALAGEEFQRPQQGTSPEREAW